MVWCEASLVSVMNRFPGSRRPRCLMHAGLVRACQVCA